MGNKEIKQKVEALREECQKLNSVMASFLDGGMKEKAVIVLLKHYTGIPMKTIKLVLAGLHDLEFEYFNQEED